MRIHHRKIINIDLHYMNSNELINKSEEFDENSTITDVDGRIFKGIGGFYYVKTPIGMVTTKGRGNLKRDGATLYVGDEVKLTILNKNHQSNDKELKGIIEDVMPRCNYFVRPQVANVDLVAMVVSATKPKANLKSLDKFLCVCETKNVDCIICVNKTEDENAMAAYEQIHSIYKDVYETVAISAKNLIGIDNLRNRFEGLTVALAGPSGVGKSTIMNALIGRGHMEVGEISQKTNRGKHTTRHVELIPLDKNNNSFIFDTPGFTSLELPDIDKYDLRLCFPEIEKLGAKCAFKDCLHIREPGCAVLDAVSKGQISSSRYNSYEMFLKDIINKKKY